MIGVPPLCLQTEMKTLLCSLLILSTAALTYADIQDPPINDYGPTRKLSRALANISPRSLAEIPENICEINGREGVMAASTYGVVKGVGRVFYRWGMGFYEFFTWPFPTYKGSYRPPYLQEIPWIHGGYEEFPPELGFQTKFNYVRTESLY